MSGSVAAYNRETFQHSLSLLNRLQAKTHGDTLAVFLGLKRHQPSLPVVGSAQPGVSSGYLEDMLDEMYLKCHRGLGKDTNRVVRIFSGRFTPCNSYSQNNWRDFFRYGLGVGCLAPTGELDSEFLAQPRSECRHLVTLSDGVFGCELHPMQTRYIRSLAKPKLLHWSDPGPGKGSYKIVNLDDPRLVEVVRAITMHIPLEALLTVLYFGAPWSGRKTVSVEQFAGDFHFAGSDEVEYLFASDVSSKTLRPLVLQRQSAILALLERPFRMQEPIEEESLTARRVRGAAFRQVVRDSYRNACAVCGMDVTSTQGRSCVQACHIFPRKLGGTDDVRNGLALCHSHHWAFDEGMFVVMPDWKLRWKRSAAKGDLPYRRLALPQEQKLWPDQEQALAWHRGRFGGEEGPATSTKKGATNKTG